MRIPADLARALARWARERGVPKSQVAREAVARYLSPATRGEGGRRVTGGDLAARWPSLPRLTPEEAARFGDDIADLRGALAAVRQPWE